MRVLPDPPTSFLPSFHWLFFIFFSSGRGVKGYNQYYWFQQQQYRHARAPASPAAFRHEYAAPPSHPPTFVRQANRKPLKVRRKTEGEGGAVPFGYFQHTPLPWTQYVLRPNVAIRTRRRRDGPADLPVGLGLLDALRVLLMQARQVHAAGGVEAEEPIGLPGVLGIT